MPSKKRTWNLTTVDRYKVKAFRMAKAQGVPDHMAETMAEVQSRVWNVGAGRYKAVREIVSDILDEEKVSPVWRGPFQAYGQWLVKQLEKGDYPPQLLWQMSIAKWKFEGWSLRIAQKIAKALGLDVTRFQQPEQKPQKKAGST